MKSLIFAFTTLLALNLWAHGDDKLGPNGGYVSMPGPFHVELVSDGHRNLKVYLLDMEWKNPIVADSAIEMTHGKEKAKCKAKTDFFSCEFSKAVDLTKKGEVTVTARRGPQQGLAVKYALPLKLKESR